MDSRLENGEPCLLSLMIHLHKIVGSQSVNRTGRVAPKAWRPAWNLDTIGKSNGQSIRGRSLEIGKLQACEPSPLSRGKRTRKPVHSKIREGRRKGE